MRKKTRERWRQRQELYEARQKVIESLADNLRDYLKSKIAPGVGISGDEINKEIRSWIDQRMEKNPDHEGLFKEVANLFSKRLLSEVKKIKRKESK